MCKLPVTLGGGITIENFFLLVLGLNKLFDDKIRVNFLEKLWLVYTNLSFTLLITVIYNYISYSYFFYENLFL